MAMNPETNKIELATNHEAFGPSPAEQFLPFPNLAHQRRGYPSRARGAGSRRGVR